MLQYIISAPFFLLSIKFLYEFFRWRSMGDFGWTLDRAQNYWFNFIIFLVIGSFIIWL